MARQSPNRSRGWAAVAVLLLIAACGSSDGEGEEDSAPGASSATTSSDTVPEEVGPTRQDHWHSVYGVYVCDGFREGVYLDQPSGERGIHTHDDGLIHIHPFTAETTGAGATVGAFFEQVGAVLDDDRLGLPDGTLLTSDSADCGGQPAGVRVVVWPQLDGDQIRVARSGVRGVHLDGDGQRITIAWVPEALADEQIPPPDDTFLRQYLALPGAPSPTTAPRTTAAPIPPELVADIEDISAQAELADPNHEVLLDVDAREVFLVDAPVLDGSHIASAVLGADPGAVFVTLTDEGGTLFDEFAAAHQGQRLAIVIDDVVLSAPVIQTGRFGGQLVISGLGDHPLGLGGVRAALMEQASSGELALGFGLRPVLAAVPVDESAPDVLGDVIEDYS